MLTVNNVFINIIITAVFFLRETRHHSFPRKKVSEKLYVRFYDMIHRITIILFVLTSSKFISPKTIELYIHVYRKEKCRLILGKNYHNVNDFIVIN